jgi:hypothetical protein
LGQNYNRWGKGSSEAGWAKITTDGEKVQAKQVGSKLQPMGGGKGWTKIIFFFREKNIIFFLKYIIHAFET